MSYVVVRARESAAAFASKFALLIAATIVAFFALPFHHSYQLPPLPTWSATLEKPVKNVSAALRPSVFEQELSMTPKELINRWNPFIEEASKKFDLPKSWIRAVVNRESGGRTVEEDGQPITSDAGAIGVMQVMPQTYDEMRAQYALGDNAADPHDNIIAGAAYLRWLYKRYGFPDMFAAYNDGPGNFDKYRSGERSLPAETTAYLASMKQNLDTPRRSKNRSRSA
ncbi:MAG TPA: lytic transglycosylase domain-containing protein [Rhizomicrobium sp.]